MRFCIIPLLAITFSSGAFAQGSLTPPGPPASTMKTLAQIEARTPIATAPFTITRAGSYYLTTNLVVPMGDAITISTNSVMLDLNGFTITSTALSANGTAVNISGNLRNITVMNGFIESGVTNNGVSSYSGSGFVAGVWAGGAPFNIRVTGVSVSGVLQRGIVLSSGGNANNTIVESCTVRTSGGNGITASIVRGCTATECGAGAIIGDQVSDCYGAGTAGGPGIQGITVQNSTGISNTGIGLSANNSAINCYGFSTSGSAGLYAYNAAYCTGIRAGGVAISATIANGCIAQFGSGTNLITYKYNMP